MKDKRAVLASLPADDDEKWIPCSDIKRGDTIPDIGTIDAISEPASDGAFHVRTNTGATVGLMWGGIVRRKR